jgi:hypothetical protein
MKNYFRGSSMEKRLGNTAIDHVGCISQMALMKIESDGEA